MRSGTRRAERFSRSLFFRFLRLGLALLVTGCSESVEPDPSPGSPEPFPDARSVHVWLYVTGLVLQPGGTFRQGLYAREIGKNFPDYYTYPPSTFDSFPSAYRMTWWSSDPRRVTVSQTGRLAAQPPGEALIWVQVESDRDSAVVRVGPSGGSRLLRYLSIHAGLFHSCALTDDGRAFCWGWDAYGALGRGEVRFFTSAAAPGSVVGEHVFTYLSMRADHACGLTAAGEAWCWGFNYYGQLGNGQLDRGDTEPFVAGEPSPVRVRGAPLAAVTAGAYSTCGLNQDRAAYCWGSNLFGQLGVGPGAQGETPPDVSADPIAVAGSLRFRFLTAGIAHVCGVTVEDEPSCWGLNNRWQLGNPAAEYWSLSVCQWACSTRPVRVETDLSFVALAPGVEHTCGLVADGRAVCWGSNRDGQLGSEASEWSLTPLPVTGDLRFVALVSGGFHTCGLTASGEAYCWGANDYGQLGRGERNFQANPSPHRVAGELVFTALAPGQSHTCGLTAEGDAYCWGSSAHGRLGNGAIQPMQSGETTVIATPVLVVEPM